MSVILKTISRSFGALFRSSFNFSKDGPLSAFFIDYAIDHGVKNPLFINDDDNIQEGERVYFTNKNATKIDRAMTYINQFVESKYRAFLYAVQFCTQWSRRRHLVQGMSAA